MPLTKAQKTLPKFLQDKIMKKKKKKKKTKQENIMGYGKSYGPVKKKKKKNMKSKPGRKSMPRKMASQGY